MGSPSTTWWDDFKQTVEHPIDSISGASSEAVDILSGPTGPADLLNTVWSGKPPLSQVIPIAKQTRQDVLNAGGTQAQADAAYNEVLGYVNANGGTSDGAIGSAISSAAEATGDAFSKITPSATALKEVGVGLIIVLGLVAWILHEA